VWGEGLFDWRVVIAGNGGGRGRSVGSLSFLFLPGRFGVVVGTSTDAVYIKVCEAVAVHELLAIDYERIMA